MNGNIDGICENWKHEWEARDGYTEDAWEAAVERLKQDEEWRPMPMEAQRADAPGDEVTLKKGRQSPAAEPPRHRGVPPSAAVAPSAAEAPRLAGANSSKPRGAAMPRRGSTSGS
jgi:hypothetical protein